MKLLIVDDSNIMRRAIEKYLQVFDLDVVGAAPNGQVALKLFKEHQPDLVTMDITMPELDGISCLQEMLQIKPETRIIIVTALSDPDTGIKAVKSGARGYLTKPFTAEQIREEIAQVIEANPESE